MGSTESSETPGVDELNPQDPVWAEISLLLQERSKNYCRHYRFNLKLERLWRIRRCQHFQDQEQQALSIGEPTQLFHGSSWQACLQIATTGFRLPVKSGMFGKGLYFASTPLKSAQFSKEGAIAFFKRWAKKGLRAALFGKQERVFILLCDVYLGKCKKLRSAFNKLEPEQDLQRSWFSRVLGYSDYNSVHAVEGMFGAVRVEEYVVYQAHQGIPRYLMQLEYDRS